MKTISPKSIKLPSSYRRIALIDVEVAFQKWVTVAEFASSTAGQIAAYARFDHGTNLPPKEITRVEYMDFLREFYITKIVSK